MRSSTETGAGGDGGGGGDGSGGVGGVDGGGGVGGAALSGGPPPPPRVPLRSDDSIFKQTAAPRARLSLVESNPIRALIGLEGVEP